MHCVQAKAIINCKRSELMDFFWDMKKWKEFWSPLQEITVSYDDGLFQEFSIKIDWQESIHLIRTARLRIHNEIFLFSPEPPPPTTIHRGVWRFTEKKEGTVVEAVRFFACPGTFEQVSKFSQNFEKRLEKILDTIVKQWET